MRTDRENAHAHALLGDLAYLRHDLEGAKGEWAQALALNPQRTAIGGQIAQADLELALESRMEPVQLGSLVVRVPASGGAEGIALPLATLKQAVEGLAQEAEAISEGAGAIGSLAPEGPARDDAELPPLKRLLGIADRPGEAVVMPAGQFYGGSHILVRYLLELKGWDGMRRLLGALGQGKSVEQALEDLTGWDLPTLEKKWRALDLDRR